MAQVHNLYILFSKISLIIFQCYYDLTLDGKGYQQFSEVTGQESCKEDLLC